MQSIVMLGVSYAECHIQALLSVVVLNVVRLSVVAS